MNKEQLKETLEKHKHWLETRFTSDPQGQRADLTRADLRGADLTRADLTDADLTRANLTDADLRRANLTDAALRSADLTDAALRSADLRRADLRRANLTRADLTDADLTDANLTDAALRGANLTDADLTDADLTRADLTPIKEDIFDILDRAPDEVSGLLDALNAGKIEGRVYEGQCACLVGTIANLRGQDYQDMRGILPDSNRPAERWFLAIKKGHTPKNCPVTKITAEWTEEWLAANTTPEK